MDQAETLTFKQQDQVPFVLGRIEGKLELILTRLNMRDADWGKMNDENTKRFTKIEDRIAALEAKAYRALGTAAGLFGAASVIGLLIKYILSSMSK
jgi:hypothetical protein